MANTENKKKKQRKKTSGQKAGQNKKNQKRTSAKKAASQKTSQNKKAQRRETARTQETSRTRETAHGRETARARDAVRAQETARAQTASSGRKTAARRKAQKRVLAQRLIFGFLIVILIGVAVWVYMSHRTYHNYKIVTSTDTEDTISTKYEKMGNRVLRYSPDGASLINNNLETLWSQSYDMASPTAWVKGSCAVVADIDGTTMAIFDKNGLTGTVNTSYSIVKASISEGGTVAAILDAGDDTWINFYAQDGTLIAENQTKVDDPGYPMDVAISPNGVIMMVTYQFVEGSNTTSYVAFYNFGSVGQNQEDRIVSGYTYEGTVIPQLDYFDASHSIAIKDNGFTIYKGKQIPKEDATIEVDQEIVSSFVDDDMVGLVFKNDNADKPYTMEVYSSSGSMLFTKDFNIPYTTITSSDGNIILYNSSQISIMNKKGTERYSGTVDGTVKDILKLGWGKYLLILDNSVNVIRLN